MKFTCAKTDLTKAINTAIRAVNTKLSRSILECLRITCSKDQATVDAFDMTTAIKTTIYAVVEEEGVAAIPARVLSEIVSKLPDGEVTIESGQKTEEGVRISCGGTNARLSMADVSQFPNFPEVTGEPFSVLQGKLRDMIEKTVFSVYLGEDKPIFTGLLFEMEEDEFSLVGIDGVRMAKRSIPWQGRAQKSVVVPAKALRELSKSLVSDDAPVSVVLAEKACQFLTEDTVIYTRLLEGQFFNYKSVIPQGFKTKVRVETRMMERSLEIVSVLAKEDNNNLMRMKISEGALEFVAESEYGQIEDKIPAYCEGELLSIAFNSRYLLDVFHNINDDSVIMEFDSKLSPCIIRPLEGDEFFYLVVPMRFNG